MQSIRGSVRDAWKFMIFSFVRSFGRSAEKFIRCALFKKKNVAVQRHETSRFSYVSVVKNEKKKEKKIQWEREKKEERY